MTQRKPNYILAFVERSETSLNLFEIMSFYAYIATNKSFTLYIGYTNNIERRVFEHEMKANPNSFTAKYNINKLIYAEEFPSIEQAKEAEKVLKGWTRKKKLELIKTINPHFQDLLID